MLCKPHLKLSDNLHITIIYGRAGTGKSTLLSSMLNKCVNQRQSYIMLTSTHSSLNNIYNISSKQSSVDRQRFKTIYAYFRIDYQTGTMLGCNEQILPSFIFIDEFSLINKLLFKQILIDINKHINNKQTVQLVLSGDALQLNAIYTDKQYISLNKLKKLKSITTISLNPNVIEHIHLSIFGLSSMMSQSVIKRNLTTNYRNGTTIMNTLNAIYSRNRSFDYKFVDIFDVINLIINNDYVFLSSRHKIIQHVYNMLSERWDYVQDIKQNDISWGAGLRYLHLYPGAPLMITCTSTSKRQSGEPEYYNGEYVTYTGNMECNGTQLKCINQQNEVIYIKQEVDLTIPGLHKYFPVIPKQLISIHKSQGQTIDNVIVCIDELFDMSMLYTAITRAKNNVCFYTTVHSSERIDKLFDSAFIDDFRQLMTVVNKLSKDSC